MTHPSTIPVAEPKSKRGTPTWELARMFPQQGDWTERDYLNLDAGQLIEYQDGCLEFLPLPPPSHQLIAQYLLLQLHAYALLHKTGRAFLAPMPLRLRPGLYREPDVVYVARSQLPSLHEQPSSAVLVIEVVSPEKENRDRDYEQKRLDYATAGIPEYWIVDPERQCITLLSVTSAKSYETPGEFHIGQTLESLILPGFTVDVAAVFVESLE